jgi:hypothetical protein
VLWNISLPALPVQYVDMVGNGSSAHNDETLTIRTRGDFIVDAHIFEDKARNFFVNWDDTQIDDVTFKSMARRNSSMLFDSPEKEMEEANPTGPNEPALLTSKHES